MFEKNNEMKKIVVVAILLISCHCLKAQETNKSVIVVLKNGHTIKGILIEKNEDKFIKIKGKDGGITEYN